MARTTNVAGKQGSFPRRRRVRFLLALPGRGHVREAGGSQGEPDRPVGEGPALPHPDLKGKEFQLKKIWQ